MRSASDVNSDAYNLTKVISRDQWIPDKSVKFCKVCFRKFSLMIRRHHCRVCGHVFCNSCAPKLGLYSGGAARMCGSCCDERVAEIQENLRQQKERELKLVNLQQSTTTNWKQKKEEDSSHSSPPNNSPLSQKDTLSKSASPVSSNYSFTPSKKEEDLDPQSKHKLRQQQLRIQSALQDEIKSKEKRETSPSSRKATMWSPPERIRCGDLGYNLEKATRVDVQIVAQLKWMLDTDTRKCLDCGFPFDSVIRRHHCRVCGAIFCSSCVPEVGIYHGVPVRICADCYHHAKETKKHVDQEQQARKALVTEALKKRKSEILGEKSVV